LDGPGTRIQLCGPFVVRVAGERVEDRLRGQQKVLFAYLAANRARTCSRDELVAALWPGAAPPSAATAFNAILSKLRRALGDGTVDGRSRLRLVLPPDALVDVESAGEALHRATAAVAQQRWTDAWGPAHVAIHTANRGFLPGCELPWVHERRSALDELLLTALECLARAALGIGECELPTAERAARRLVREAPFRETGRILLMEALAAQGNVAEALRVYDDLRGLLRDELGVAPGAAAQRAHEWLLHGGSAPRTAPASATG
jgi:DNA-binding SARP family transcriptional activator